MTLKHQNINWHANSLLLCVIIFDLKVEQVNNEIINNEIMK